MQIFSGFPRKRESTSCYPDFLRSYISENVNPSSRSDLDKPRPFIEVIPRFQKIKDFTDYPKEPINFTSDESIVERVGSKGVITFEKEAISAKILFKFLPFHPIR